MTKIVLFGVGSPLVQEYEESPSRANVEIVFGVRNHDAAVQCTGQVKVKHRDDLEVVGPRPIVGGSDLPTSGIDDQCVVLVDDVAYTGRTSRAALNEVSDWGRPRRILLCVLVDRGGRELPIHPDVTGRGVQVLEGQRVEVLVPEHDGRLGVDVVQAGGSAE